MLEVRQSGDVGKANVKTGYVNKNCNYMLPPTSLSQSLAVFLSLRLPWRKRTLEAIFVTLLTTELAVSESIVILPTTDSYNLAFY